MSSSRWTAWSGEPGLTCRQAVRTGQDKRNKFGSRYVVTHTATNTAFLNKETVSAAARVPPPGVVDSPANIRLQFQAGMAGRNRYRSDYLAQQQQTCDNFDYRLVSEEAGLGAVETPELGWTKFSLSLELSRHALAKITLSNIRFTIGSP